VGLELTLPQGGAIYSFSPVVKGIDPNARGVTTLPTIAPQNVT